MSENEDYIPASPPRHNRHTPHTQRTLFYNNNNNNNNNNKKKKKKKKKKEEDCNGSHLQILRR